MVRPDRIVILNDFSSTKGGAGFLADALARAVAAQDTPVTFITGDSGTGDQADGIERVALEGTALLNGKARSAAKTGLYNTAAARRVADWIARNDTARTVYHLHNWSNILSPAIFDALAPVANRCVIHAHDFFLACPNGAYLDYPRAQICNRTPLSISCLATQCDKRAYAHKLWRSARQKVAFGRMKPHLDAATFVMINEAMRPWLNRAIAPAHMIAIPNPVTPFGTAATAPENAATCAHIGQIQRLKGVHDLAEAGRRLGVSISFFGDGEDLDALRAAYPEHIWHGFTSREDIARHLQQTRAVVVATQSPEPFCLAAFESAATGVPLIVSDAILASDTLVEQGVGVEFQAGNVADLMAVLDNVLNDDALVATMASAARARGTTLGNSLADWADAHIQLYGRIIERDPVVHRDMTPPLTQPSLPEHQP